VILIGGTLSLAAPAHPTVAKQIFVRARSQHGGAAQSTQVVKLLEDALGTDLRAPAFPRRWLSRVRCNMASPG
jgi:hypothetical protein